MNGDKASKKGFMISRDVASARTEEVVCISCGNLSKRRAVTKAKKRGTSENSRRLAE